MLVYYKADLIIISLKINLFSPSYSWKIAELALNSNHSFLFNINISLLAHNLKYLKKGYFLFSGNPDENIHVLTGLMVTQSKYTCIDRFDGHSVKIYMYWQVWWSLSQNIHVLTGLVVTQSKYTCIDRFDGHSVKIYMYWQVWWSLSLCLNFYHLLAWKQIYIKFLFIPTSSS